MKNNRRNQCMKETCMRHWERERKRETETEKQRDKNQRKKITNIKDRKKYKKNMKIKYICDIKCKNIIWWFFDFF